MVQAVRRQVRDWQASGMLGQLFRFGITGGLSTLIYAAVYLPLATHVLPPRHAVLAVPPAFLVAAVFGYVAHSSWSFRGHGSREGKAGGRQARFLSVQAFGMLLNAAFTWVITGPWLHGAAWIALVPAVFVTPLATFALNRRWVFA